MILTINDNVQIEDIKDHFAECFPGLKIEFYKRVHGHKQSSADKQLISPYITVGSIRSKGASGEYKIYSYYTVSRIESELKAIYGLNIQVFRNENNEWIQTSGTDHFTLAKQMELCKNAGNSIIPPTKQQLDEYDYL